MKMKWIVTHALFVLLTSAKLTAAGNAPIQQVDVANMLSNGGGASATSVTVTFATGITTSTPCHTTTLAYQSTITVLAGIGQVCATPITSITIKPISGTLGMIYSTPTYPVTINGSLYSTQMIINQANPPVFDPSNGSLTTPGTIQEITVSNFTNAGLLSTKKFIH